MPAKEELLDLGIIPKNTDLNPDEIKRWFKGMERSAQIIRDEEIKKFMSFVHSLCPKPSEDLTDAIDAFSEWCPASHTALFYDTPDCSRFLDTIYADPIGFSSQNQADGKDWTSAEYYLVACNRNGRQIVDFGWLEEPYNLVLGEGIEMEKGCKRRVWRFEVTEVNRFEDLNPKKVDPENVSLFIWRQFVKGKN